MKLSDCKLGILVQNKDKTYDEALSKKECGIINNIIEDNTGQILIEVKLISGMVEYKYYSPEQLKLLED